MSKTKTIKLTKPKFEFSIDRSKWTRDILLNSEGNMCALGFLSKALKIPKSDYLEHAGLNLSKKVNKRKFGNLGLLKCEGDTAIPNPVVTEITSANDSLYGKRRETRLKNIFAKLNIKLTFKGKRNYE